MELLQRPGNTACADCAAPGKGRARWGARAAAAPARTAPHGSARRQRGGGGFCLSGHLLTPSSPPLPIARGMQRGCSGAGRRDGDADQRRSMYPPSLLPAAPRPAVAALMSSPAGPRGLQCSPGVGNPAASGRRGLGGLCPGGCPVLLGTPCPPCPLARKTPGLLSLLLLPYQ